jgi:hypothetical protein
MILGFSGTRKGMTAGQKDSLRQMLVELQPEEFHHGDFIGSRLPGSRHCPGEHESSNSHSSAG